MVTFGKLHFMILAANFALVINKYSSVVDFGADEFGKAEGEAYIQFFCQVFESTRGIQIIR